MSRKLVRSVKRGSLLNVTVIMVTEDLRLSVAAACEKSSDKAFVDVVELTRVRFAELYGACIATANVPTLEIEEFEAVVSECLLGLEKSHARESWKRQAIERLRFYQKACRVLIGQGIPAAKALVSQTVKALRNDSTDFGLQRSRRAR